MENPNNFHLEHLKNPPEGFESIFIADADGGPAELCFYKDNKPNYLYPGTFEDCRRLFAEMSGQPIEKQEWFIVCQ